MSSRISDETKQAIMKAFYGSDMAYTQRVWGSLKLCLDKESFQFLKLLWVTHKRWVKGKSYRDQGYVSKAFQAYRQGVDDLFRWLASGGYDIPWSYRRFEAPMTVMWGSQSALYYGQVSLKLPTGKIVSFLDDHPERSVDFTDTWSIPIYRPSDEREQGTDLLRFFQSLDNTPVDTKKTSVWDLLLEN